MPLVLNHCQRFIYCLNVIVIGNCVASSRQTESKSELENAPMLLICTYRLFPTKYITRLWLLVLSDGENFFLQKEKKKRKRQTFWLEQGFGWNQNLLLRVTNTLILCTKFQRKTFHVLEITFNAVNLVFFKRNSNP